MRVSPVNLGREVAPDRTRIAGPHGCHTGPVADQAALQGAQHRLRAVAGTELDQEIRDMVLHRALGQVQHLGDLAIAVPTGDEAQHVGFARRQSSADRGAGIERTRRQR
ncbi:hypothetical protein GCM10010915_12530 [Microbacterium faecale]|uniref:Uncharacterized protein n=1 Tax=Microbacterium faecale TaxID=1804630 RepID=A0A916Y7Y7_9MICO|nr:hypothetical protein GCM10010915_12530 [Microbacterium faecale]